MGHYIQLPRLRSLAFYQFAGDEDVARASLWLAPLARFFPQRADDFHALAARYPNDPKEQWFVTEGIGFEHTVNLEPLLRRFPTEAWLRADYVISVCSQFKSGRIPGSLATSAPGVAPPPEKPANLSPARLERAIAVCREGAALEPQNCFWDLIAAQFLFSAPRCGSAPRDRTRLAEAVLQ